MAFAALGTDRAASLVFLGGVSANSPIRRQADLAARFYGLEMTEVNGQSAVAAVRRRETVAVIVAAEALTTIDRRKLFSSLARRGKQVPLLIGADGREFGSLSNWSGGAVTGCEAGAGGTANWNLRVHPSEIARQLSGAILGFEGSVACVLRLAARGSTRVLVDAFQQGEAFPLFVRAEYQGYAVFVAAGMHATGTDSGLMEAFSSMLPVMAFLRYAAGEQAWHAAGHYANLTVDDPWLCEKYGHLDYRALSLEMAKHRFHTTIAFVPWNFDRSRREIVNLCADRFRP